MTKKMPDTRTETDSLGSIEIAGSALYGSNTARALENFPLSSKTLGQETNLLYAIVEIKKACALANSELGVLDTSITNAVEQACDEILTGNFNEHFPMPLLEGSGGTSTNMNVNEVICNRALQVLGSKPGDYHVIHPNDHVNKSQSTNDVLPSAIKLASYRLATRLSRTLSHLADALNQKAMEFHSVFRVGRTCLQDAQPMTLGQAISGYAAGISRAAHQIETCASSLTALPLGGTAIGTGMGSTTGFKQSVYKHLSCITDISLSATDIPFDGMQNLDALQRLSAELETASAVIAKISKDLILLSSGPAGGIGEINLPAVQPGSSIMPGKVNPVLPMAMIQLSQVVHGNHACIAMACQDGMLEINHYEMVVASKLFDSLNGLIEQVPMFTTQCIGGITANEKVCREQLHRSYALATALVPDLGYQTVSKLVTESVTSDTPFVDVCIAHKHFDQADIPRLLKMAADVTE